MAKILDMPKLSPTMEEGVLSIWHKREGDAVEIDDLLAEVETDKATMEFRAFDKGTLLTRLVPSGAHVKLGQPVAILGAPGEDVAALVAGAGAPSASQAPTAAPAPAAMPAQISPPPPAPAPTTPPTPAPPPPRTAAPRGDVLSRTERPAPRDAPAEGRVLASPYIRKTARDRGLDLRGARGSGPGGRLVAADLDRLAGDGAPGAAPAVTRPASPSPSPSPSSAHLAEPETRALSMMRKTIARRLTESKQTVPHFYLSIEVDAAPLLLLRESINRELEATVDGAAHGGGRDGGREGGVAAGAAARVSLNDLLVKACAVALVRVPECNASFSGDAILVHKRVDISVAVAISEGLITPVVRDADRKSVLAIAREARDLAARARAKKLRPEEMTDGTFSLSNLGMFGVDAFAAIINPPEGAILAVGRARDAPVVKDGAVIAGKTMAMTLSCDHRAIDGAVGAAFLAELRILLERPLRILTG